MIRPLLIGLICLCGEVFLREVLTSESWTPPLFILFMVWVGSRSAVGEAIASAALIGLVADGFARAPLGVHPLQGLVVVYVSLLCKERIQLQGILHSALLGLVGGIASLLTLGMLSRWMLGEGQLAARMAELLVPVSVMTSVLAPGLFALFDRWGRRRSSPGQLSRI